MQVFDPLQACNMSRDVVQLKYPHEEDCCICLTSMKNKKVKFMRCQHVFHAACIAPWLEKKGTCPNCRLLIKPPRQNLESVRRNILEILDSVDLSSLHAILFDETDHTGSEGYDID